ncbi:hypothetical protein HOLleu_11007 [Holothuria leucospilota]|uniref:Uncharacterized protein n=1 Tax=Holothuria leucospilota TaxID=206669 RepID=A0A9Q1CFM0_HOLLE|nr:hypothetical protein HOLleu_11007 [Holothuria leucospilota]
MNLKSTFLVWIEKRVLPDFVANHRRLTQPRRADWLFTSKKDLSQLLSHYPRLLDTPGMIEEDFLLQFSPVSLKDVWNHSLSEKLIMYAQTQDRKWEDKLEVAGYGKDHVIFVSLQLLPLILSPGRMMSSSGKKVRATTLDALCGFVEVKPVEYFSVSSLHQHVPFFIVLACFVHRFISAHKNVYLCI